MGLFSKSKPKKSTKPHLKCSSGQAASFKCIYLASIRQVSMDIEWCEPTALDDKMSESLNLSNISQYPCIEDGDFTICGESAVLTYLNVKGKAPTIHPRKARVLAMQQYWIQVLSTKFNDENDIAPSLNQLEKTLEDKKFIVGELSLADIHWAAAFKALEVNGNSLDMTKYKNINAWLSNMKKEIPNYEASDEEVAA